MSDQYIFRNGRWCDDWNGTDDTQPHAAAEDGWTWWESILCMHLCGCASTDRIGEAMKQYLLAVDAETMWGEQWTLELELLAHLADQTRFTDHGGNVVGSWLTDAGRRWLELYDAKR